MNYTLNDAQMSALTEVAESELRTVEQMLSLLLAEGVRFYFCDYESPHGRVNDVKIVNSLTQNAKMLTT